MPLFLTDDQSRALADARGEVVRLVDPKTNTEYVVVPASDYDIVREEIEDARFQRAWVKLGMETMARRLKDEPWPQ